MKKTAETNLVVCRNRKAGFAFELLDKIECGIVLLGTEVKSLRDRNASLNEAYARIEGGELFLIGFHIASYKFGTTTNHEPLRRRKLLVHARQLRKLKMALVQKGLTLVPLSVYFNDRGLAKVELALASGKSHRDKREDMKRRDDRREMDRATRRRSGKTA